MALRDGKDCGAYTDKSDPCILDVGHEGKHDDGKRQWADAPKKKGGAK